MPHTDRQRSILDLGYAVNVKVLPAPVVCSGLKLTFAVMSVISSSKCARYDRG